MAFNLPEYYTRGAGKLFIGERNLATGGLLTTTAAGGLQFLGDASEYTLDPSQEFVEHMEHQTGDGRKDVRSPRSTTLSGNLVLDNTGAANLKRFLRGKQTAVTSATISGEAHAFPGVGGAIKLAQPVATFTELLEGADVQVEGTDYRRNGQVIYFPAGTTTTGEVTATYVSAAHQSVDLFAENFREFYVFFQGFNTINRKAFSLELFKVSFDPSALGNLLGDEIVQMTLGFEALFEPLKATSNLGGYGNYAIAE